MEGIMMNDYSIIVESITSHGKNGGVYTGQVALILKSPGGDTKMNFPFTRVETLDEAVENALGNLSYWLSGIQNAVQEHLKYK